MAKMDESIAKYKARRQKRLDDKWITLNGKEEKGKGTHVLLNEEGEVVAGAGGALNGKKLGGKGGVSKPEEAGASKPEAPTTGVGAAPTDKPGDGSKKGKVSSARKKEFEDLMSYNEWEYSGDKIAGKMLTKWLEEAGDGTAIEALYKGNWVNFTKEGGYWTLSRSKGSVPKGTTKEDISDELKYQRYSSAAKSELAQSAKTKLINYVEADPSKKTEKKKAKATKPVKEGEAPKELAEDFEKGLHEKYGSGLQDWLHYKSGEGTQISMTGDGKFPITLTKKGDEWVTNPIPIYKESGEWYGSHSSKFTHRLSDREASNLMKQGWIKDVKLGKYYPQKKQDVDATDFKMASSEHDWGYDGSAREKRFRKLLDNLDEGDTIILENGFGRYVYVKRGYEFNHEGSWTDDFWGPEELAKKMDHLDKDDWDKAELKRGYLKKKGGEEVQFYG